MESKERKTQKKIFTHVLHVKWRQCWSRTTSLSFRDLGGSVLACFEARPSRLLFLQLAYWWLRFCQSDNFHPTARLTCGIVALKVFALIGPPPLSSSSPLLPFLPPPLNSPLVPLSLSFYLTPPQTLLHIPQSINVIWFITLVRRPFLWSSRKDWFLIVFPYCGPSWLTPTRSSRHTSDYRDLFDNFNFFLLLQVGCLRPCARCRYPLRSFQMRILEFRSPPSPASKENELFAYRAFEKQASLSGEMFADVGIFSLPQNSFLNLC